MDWDETIRYVLLALQAWDIVVIIVVRMAKKKTTIKIARPRQLNQRYTEREYALIQGAILRSGKTQSEWIRDMLVSSAQVCPCCHQEIG